MLTALAKVKGQKPPDYARDQGLGRHFESSIKGASKVGWDDEKSRSEFLAGLVSDAHRALRLAAQVRGEVEEASPVDERIEAGCRLLATILLQDLEVKREPKAGEQVVIKRETAVIASAAPVTPR